MTDAVERIVALFESITPAQVARLGDYYRDDAYFKDPFNEVRGLAAVQRVFQHMFDALEDPRFVVTQRMAQGEDALLMWEFHFRFRGGRGGAQCVPGVSHLKLAADGRIAYHRDYWDPAEGIYERIPLLGALMRWIKRRAGG
jgi:ketosteroid isomerase-like protein